MACVPPDGVRSFPAMGAAPQYDEVIWLPKAVRFPVELLPPDGFDPEDLGTWPSVVGRLEFTEGKLVYMPPCGDLQQDTVADVVVTLGAWVRRHREFVLATNEAGMRLGNATRAADVAVFRRKDVGAPVGGLRRHPPVLAVEVAGESEGEPELLQKAGWYLSVGVTLVWILLPEERRVIVVTSSEKRTYDRSETIAEHPALPGLSASVADLFFQLDV